MKTGTVHLVALYAVLMGILLLSQIKPAVLITDEVAYSLMANDFAQHGRLDIWNGFDEVQSRELVLPSMELAYNATQSGDEIRINDVRMYGIPAPLYTFIAYPFFKACGLSGLVALNVVAYSAMIVIVYCLARFFLDERWSALAAVAYSILTNAFVFTGYVIPHMLSVCLVCLPTLLVFRSVSAGKSGWSQLFLAGLVVGLGAGVRFTNMLFAVGLGALILYELDRRSLYPFIAGLLAPLFAIAWIGYISYGSPFETGYGNIFEFIGLKYVLLFSMIIVGVYLYATRKVSNRTALIACAVLGVLALVIAWDQVLVIGSALYARLFDMGLDPTDIKVSYKKALLQSSPFLVLSAFCLLYVPKDSKRRMYLLMAVFSLLTIAYYSTRSHGGSDETYSMRYFMEAIPFLTVLSVHSFSRMFKRLDRLEYVAVSAAFALTAFAYLRDGNVIFSVSQVMRSLPAVAALMTFASCIVYLRTGRYRLLCVVLVAVCVAMSFSFQYSDWKVLGWYTGAIKDLEGKLSKAVADDSAVFVRTRTYAVLFAPAKMEKRVRVVVTSTDGMADAEGLVDFYARRGVAAYYLNINYEDAEWLSFMGNLSQRGGIEPLNVVGDYPLE